MYVCLQICICACLPEIELVLLIVIHVYAVVNDCNSVYTIVLLCFLTSTAI